YDVNLKKQRLSLLEHPNFKFIKADISHKETIDILKKETSDYDVIIHLAAQAGVRYSLENPYVYVESNVMGHLNLLELAKDIKNLRNFVFSSTSSVYGANEKLPFSVEDRTDSPLALYAATKKCG